MTSPWRYYDTHFQKKEDARNETCYCRKAQCCPVSVGLLCAMQEDYRYAETSVKLSCRGEEFTQKGRTVLQPGWKVIWNSFYPEKKKDDEVSGTVM